MIRLDGELRKLQAKLAGAVTTRQLRVVVCYTDEKVMPANAPTPYDGATKITATNSTTAVDICLPPARDAQNIVRYVDSISVCNVDTAAATVTIQYSDSGTLRILVKAALAVGDTLHYSADGKWRTLDSSGRIKEMISASLAASIHGATSKTTPVDADEFAAADSASSWALVKVTWANIKATYNAALNFLQAGTGAVARTNQNKMRDIVSVKDFGAVGDGVTNDTAAMQAAHDTGKVIFYPEGNYSFTTISIADGGIVGEGNGTRLLSTDATSADLIACTSNGGSGAGYATPEFRNFHIEAVNTKAAGAALRFAPSGGVELENLYVRNVRAYNAPRGFHFTSCIYGSICECAAINYSDAGIYYEESVTPGAGDFSIENNTIYTAAVSGNRYGICQASGGGLRIIGNKILGGASGFVLAYAGSTASGPLIISANSIENQINFGIYLGSASQAFGGITITGNEIAQVPQPISTDAAGNLSEINISSNYLAISSDSSNGVALRLNNVDGFNVSGNHITGNDGTTVGVDITSTCTTGLVGVNQFNNFDGGSAFKIVNASTTTAQINSSGSSIIIGANDAVQTYTGFSNLTISGSTAAGIVELITQGTDADALNSGSYRWTDKNSTNADKTAAVIQTNLQGTTANNRGSKMRFFTKADNGAGVTERMSIDNVGNIKAFATLQLGGYTVATLPAGTLGMTAYVTDATAPTYLGALVGGGAVACPVFYNGAAWVSH